MFKLIRLEWKKNNVGKYIRNAVIMAALICLFIFALCYLGIANDPETGVPDAAPGNSAVSPSIELFTSMAFVFMTYANVVFSYGVERFVSECRESEIDGLILPDLPFEEKEEFHPLCKQYGIELISMVAPTSEKRIAMIARKAEGFIYIVSSLGVTGMRQEIKTDLSSIVKAVRENTKIPCAVGFGISTPQQAKKMAEYADGVIVGSAIIKLLEQYGENAPQHIGAYVREIKSAL